MSDENKDNRVYNLLITKGTDPEGQYEFYKERIDSQKDFLYTEYNTQDNELNDDLFEEGVYWLGKGGSQSLAGFYSGQWLAVF